ncbi:LAQU0S15e00738g1_1 [Lachancea quebecensis]|uniref:ER membrane protein complex subunit 1 n=1 Tax=Lachancea quebecensis TaxID=1654605 RepID=A0A0P1KW91_9SACH|nr:LAQU0S15e00738g1_1 [Lachancea quebecensis]
MLGVFRSFVSITLLVAMKGLFVEAVFSDEAYHIDWQRSNIGPYQCVLPASVAENNDQLLILSTFGNGTMLSWLNKTNGELLERLPLGYPVSDAMIENNKVFLKLDNGSINVVDSMNGFSLDYSPMEFSSSCNPDLSAVRFEDGKVKIMDGDSDLQIFSIDMPQDFKGIRYLQSNEENAFDIMFSTVTGNYSFTSVTDLTSTQTWTRDESLANVRACTYVSPADPNLAQMFLELTQEGSMNLLEAYQFRVKQTLDRLKNYLLERKFSVGAIVKEFLEDEDEATSKEKDVSFGLLKYLIVATETGKIAALDVRDGRQLWYYETGLRDIIKIEALRSDTEIVVFTKSGPSLVFDVTKIEEKPFLVADTNMAPAESVEKISEEGAFLFKGPDGKRFLLQSPLNPITQDIHLLDHNSEELSAFVYQNEAITETWKIKAGEQEEIVAFSSRGEEHVANLGIVLGNRTVLYKYLYPHLAAYATKSEQNVLTVRIIDTISGELLYTAFHDDEVDFNFPINLVFGEHWCVYTYFSTKPVPEQKIAVIELYESLVANERTSEPSVEVDALENTQKPQVVQKAYLYPEVIKNIGLTKTKLGITTKSIILELENGQVTILPKFILSARRVEESQLSADDKKEFMVMPYVSAIPINDQAILTHNRILLTGPDSLLLSIPTDLESTTLVCDLGHDLFCTRVFPSSQFDKLSPSFEKGKLMATVIGLLLICFFLRPLVDTRKLKLKWLVKD